MGDTIVAAEWGALEGRRPRLAGSNARLGAHGDRVHVPLLRLTTHSGASGFGVCRAGRDPAADLLGRSLGDLIAESGGVREEWLPFEFPLWDLAGQVAGRPVYALAAEAAGAVVPDLLRVPCYDTSLYMDDLHLRGDEEAAALLASEAMDGYDLGHRAFKIKVGRGARWMPPDAGMRRDIAVIRAVHTAVGPEAALLLDSNNGWNLNLTKYALAETADCNIHWMEEPFHEDATLYRDLKEWMGAEGLPTLIADGEGDASPALLRWAQEGLVDVVQYDIFGHGLMRWLATGKRLDEWGAGSAPHHYGGHLGNHVSCHLAPALRGFTFVEWDEAAVPGLDTSAYALRDGLVSVPDAPGFGVSLDPTAFAEAVADSGWKIELPSP